MASDTSVPAWRDGDYEAILSAVTETERGRWFLAEHERRHRGAETDVVISQLEKLEKLLQRERRPDADRIKLDIGEMKDAIERTKLEISNIKVDRKIGSRFIFASNELDAIISQTEAATSEILENAEKIQEMLFAGRDEGVPADFCDKLEEYITTIYLGCSFQDLTGQRTQKVVHVLRFLESRIDSMINIWGMDESELSARAIATTSNPLDTRPDAHLLNGPQTNGEGVDQALIDEMLGGHATDESIDEMDFDSISFDAVESEAEDESTGTATAGPGLPPHDAISTAEPELPPFTAPADAPEAKAGSQADIDEMFADAAFESEDTKAANELAKSRADAIAEDVLAKLSPKERRALFS